MKTPLFAGFFSKEATLAALAIALTGTLLVAAVVMVARRIDARP